MDAWGQHIDDTALFFPWAAAANNNADCAPPAWLNVLDQAPSRGRESPDSEQTLRSWSSLQSFTPEDVTWWPALPKVGQEIAGDCSTTSGPFAETANDEFCMMDSPQRRCKSKSAGGVLDELELERGTPARKKGKLALPSAAISPHSPRREFAPGIFTPSARRLSDTSLFCTPKSDEVLPTTALSFFGTPVPMGAAPVPAFSRVVTPQARRRSLTTPPPRPVIDHRKDEEDIEIALTQDSPQLLALALMHGHDRGCCADSGAIHAAVQRRHLRALHYLIKQDSDVVAGDLDSCCPCCARRSLDLAVACSASRGDIGYRMAESLLGHGAKPTSKAGKETSRGFSDSPLHAAAKRGHAGMCELLLANGADPNAVDSDGRSALHVVYPEGGIAFGRPRDMVSLLLRFGANPCQLDKAGRTAKQCSNDLETRQLLDDAERKAQRAILIAALGIRRGFESSPVAASLSFHDIFEHVLEML
eukprot:TRINITY_DN15371_c0_g1_i1.p1 TRINITY_DN15371_c0_g1~~TRINITY_DN15371_c0_g1_i1.p1  ORF type:complete len:475 (+),score=51.53 TRINITY_DN15371_c0_g1_i1:103-1527(+)